MAQWTIPGNAFVNVASSGSRADRKIQLETLVEHIKHRMLSSSDSVAAFPVGAAGSTVDYYLPGTTVSGVPFSGCDDTIVAQAVVACPVAIDDTTPVRISLSPVEAHRTSHATTGFKIGYAYVAGYQTTTGERVVAKITISAIEDGAVWAVATATGDNGTISKGSVIVQTNSDANGTASSVKGPAAYYHLTVGELVQFAQAVYWVLDGWNWKADGSALDYPVTGANSTVLVKLDTQETKQFGEYQPGINAFAGFKIYNIDNPLTQGPAWCYKSEANGADYDCHVCLLDSDGNPVFGAPLAAQFTDTNTVKLEPHIFDDILYGLSYPLLNWADSNYTTGHIPGLRDDWLDTLKAYSNDTNQTWSQGQLWGAFVSMLYRLIDQYGVNLNTAGALKIGHFTVQSPYFTGLGTNPKCHTTSVLTEASTEIYVASQGFLNDNRSAVDLETWLPTSGTIKLTYRNSTTLAGGPDNLDTSTNDASTGIATTVTTATKAFTRERGSNKLTISAIGGGAFTALPGATVELVTSDEMKHGTSPLDVPAEFVMNMLVEATKAVAGIVYVAP